ncbi:MAG TPA: hypothetical protein VGZ22_02155 [Isosphaeraceae bacterium]|jgi:hypothetical protein|nr:hypothetical protein [Isosphaeraceae bacterium]
MILVYNLSGLLVGLAGVGVGFLTLMLTGKLALGMVAIGIVWLLFGRGRRDPETEERHPVPSLFFVPLFYLAFPVILLAIPASFVDVKSNERSTDARAVALADAVKALNSTNLSGDPELASALYNAIKDMTADDGMHVYAADTNDRALVLVKLPKLKEIDQANRRRILTKLAETLDTQASTKGHAAYLALKGKLVWGAVRTPRGEKISSAVSDDLLLDYFGPVAPSQAPQTK